MTRICTICARGGSKGVPGKNIRPLAGVPLIAHSVRQALDAGLFELVAVSSDAAAILDAARDAGAQLLIERPAAMATDHAPKLAVIAHAAAQAEAALGRPAGTLVDLDATSPLRAVADIAGAVALLEESDAACVITGAQARRSPYFNLVERDGRGIVHLSKSLGASVERRQDAPPAFDMNASIYVWRRDIFMEHPAIFYPTTRLFEMPEERSHDIDSELDFAIVEMLMTRRAA